MTSQTRYKRSDQQLVNGLTAYKLDPTQSSSALSVNTSVAADAVGSTQNPSANGATIQLISSDGVQGDSYKMVNDAVDTTYVYSSTSSSTKLQDTFDFPGFTIPAGQKVAFIRFVIRGRVDNSGVHKGSYWLYMNGHESFFNDTTWTNHTVEYDTNPATGKAWTQSDINTLTNNTVGCEAQSLYYASTYFPGYISKLYFEIWTYTDATVQYAVDVVQRAAGGAETAIGTKVAVTASQNESYYQDNPGLYSQTWACPLTSFLSTDAVVVRVYQRVGAGAWTLVQTFITEQLGAQSLDAATWTVYYYVAFASDASYVYSVYWYGINTYNSNIANFTWTAATVSSQKCFGDGFTWVTQ